jgi:hypothetical protein
MERSNKSRTFVDLDPYPRMLHRSDESRLRAAFKRRLPDFSNSGKILIDSNPAQN